MKKDPGRLLDENIIKTYNETEACRHKTRFWCEDCNTETYLLHTAISRENTLMSVVEKLKLEAGAAWVAGNHDVANKLKALANHFVEERNKVGVELADLRCKFGIKV